MRAAVAAAEDAVKAARAANIDSGDAALEVKRLLRDAEQLADAPSGGVAAAGAAAVGSAVGGAAAARPGSLSHSKTRPSAS